MKVVGLLERWTTPFTRQCWVCVGSAMVVGQLGMMLAYSVCLVTQLRDDTSDIHIDDEDSSWIASLPGMTTILGNLAAPFVMSKYGRRPATIFSSLMAVAGWMLTAAAGDLAALLTGRALQGLATGVALCTTPIAVGEYTSPSNRGAFSVMMTLMLAFLILLVHTIGAYVSWRTMAVTCTSIAAINLLMVTCSPETPSWLAERGRYEDCQRVFRWLRGNDEEDELFKLIEASKQRNDAREESIGKQIREFFSDMTKKEVYKPTIIMVHLYMFNQWCGINQLTSYAGDVITYTLGAGVDMPGVIVSLAVQRMAASLLSVYITKKMNRKTMLLVTAILNTALLLLVAGYVYCREHHLLRYDHPAVGGLLLHLLMIVMASGSLTLPFVMAAEIFPVKYRSACGGISLISLGVNLFLTVKTFPFLYSVMGLWGAFCVYAAILVYSFVVTWFLLPETKDRTLQDIEELFKGK